MVVAPGAAHGESEPDGGRRLDSIGDVFHQVFLGDDTAFVIDAVVPVEGGGEQLIFGRCFEQIAGELFDRELVERHVGVVGIDHPIAPRPLTAEDVVLVAAGVGVARGIQPDEGHAFAVGRGGQQAIYRVLPRRGTFVGQKGFDLGKGRWKPGEI